MRRTLYIFVLMLAAVAAADAQTIEEVNTPAGGNLMRRGI